MTEYEKDINKLKERILKDGDTLLSKRDLLERFCEVDEAYNGSPWNLLQILTNINILIGEEPCEDAISRSSVFEIVGNLLSIPYDLDRPINKKDVSGSMNEIRALPPVTPIRKKGKWIEERDGYGNITGWHCSNCYDKTGFVTTCTWDYCPSCGAEMESEEE